MPIRVHIEHVDGRSGQVTAIAEAYIERVMCGPDPVSDYAVKADESVHAVTGAPEWKSVSVIGPHDRRESVWSLAEKVAAWAASESRRQRNV